MLTGKADALEPIGRTGEDAASTQLFTGWFHLLTNRELSASGKLGMPAHPFTRRNKCLK